MPPGEWPGWCDRQSVSKLARHRSVDSDAIAVGMYQQQWECISNRIIPLGHAVVASEKRLPLAIVLGFW